MRHSVRLTCTASDVRLGEKTMRTGRTSLLWQRGEAPFRAHVVWLLT
jgi:hypothetical protein